uniref:Uncharacterized protein n=1 Tax=Anguilla anguilla TaxID=7936 RepID=A0A0E9U1J5_ANGAN
MTVQFKVFNLFRCNPICKHICFLDVVQSSLNSNPKSCCFFV